MDERTEEAAESGFLDISMGGRPYRLPVLTIEKSEVWQRTLAHDMAGVDVDFDDDDDGEQALTAILTQGSKAMFAALSSYDVGQVLGGETHIRERMTQRELKDAIDLITEAEFPFEEGGGRSVAAAFGLPLQVLGSATRLATANAPRRAKSANGRSPTGASPTPTSGVGGPVSNSSSAGPTDIAVLAANMKPD